MPKPRSPRKAGAIRPGGRGERFAASACHFRPSTTDGVAATPCGPASGKRRPRRTRATRAPLASIAAIAFLSVLAAPASASIQFDQQWGAIGFLNGQFTHPNRVATDSSGNVYATDAGNHRVQKFSPSGVFSLTWGSLGVGDGQFLGIQG